MNIKRILSFLFNKRQLSYLYRMANDGYLVENGWMKSFEQRRPVNKEGEPVPWITIPCLKFLGPRLCRDLSVLEYGSGNSTLYFSKRVAKVVSIESDRTWHSEVSSNLDADVATVYLKENVNEYAQFANSLDTDFDIILVDGLERLECAKQALNILSPRGVIILDNSVRKEYQPIYDTLQENGFRYLDFFGMAPGSRKDNGTTIFYREGNCLGI